ncbi:S-phase kinase-associated protein 2 isoform X2 [Mugil cephalus]|uniref:S-phase kinase-associated protein 2 isoform X2 n=1 Tax=Mugil cephalus TaxID=48193 RepID=UPI001FB723DA|nr:S-phase kinase-associated protein 2 isoform X2 [Mugil cephalus]
MPNNRIKRKSRDWLSEGLDTECNAPTELIQQWSPCHQHQQLLSKDKENEGKFILARRSRRRKQSKLGISWNHLPDELLLAIFFYLPLQDLLRISVVSKRWHRLVFDECLWHSVDLEGLTHMGPALQQVLKTGVRRLRCPRAFVEELHFTVPVPLQIVQLDLSSSIIPTSALECIICHCRQLEYLSLESQQISDKIINSLAMNTNLLQLNLSGCSRFSAPALADMLKSCSSIEQLNISWCGFNNDHVKSVVYNLSSRVTHLNLSGYRENLTLNDLKVLVDRCPQIQTLDLSDSTLLMADSFHVFKHLKCLLHLSLSRCYNIHLAALSNLGKMVPTLCLLDVFGLIQDNHLPSLKKEMPHISINSRPFSSVARPTPTSWFIGSPSGRIMWSRMCRLRFTL